MDDVTPERLQQALFDSLQGFAGKPFDPKRTKSAMVAAAMAAVPPDAGPDRIVSMDDGDYRFEIVEGENGMPCIRLTPIAYTITLTVDPNR